VNSFVCASYIDLQGIPHISAQNWSSKVCAFPNGNRGYKKKKKKKNGIIGQAKQQSSSKPSSFLSIYVAHIFQSCNKVVANFSFSYVHSFSNFLKFIHCSTFHPPPPRDATSQKQVSTKSKS
jgi:hypothetical protein